MAAKGSRKNPYTLFEYTTKVSSNTRQGGWVKESSDYIIYRNQYSEETYTGRCEKSNPVPGSLYTEMRQNGIWLGGWVSYNSNTKVYFTSNGTEYGSTLGFQDNPCPLSVYNEMLSNEIWEGGWVQDSNGQIYYVQPFIIAVNSGSGSGCGDGCGGGCGCGGAGTGLLVGGNAIYRPDVFTPNTYFEITWGNGSFLSGGQPPLSVELVNEDYLNISNLNYSWENFYRIKITFTLGNSYCDYDYNIPGQYRG